MCPLGTIWQCQENFSLITSRETCFWHLSGGEPLNILPRIAPPPKHRDHSAALEDSKHSGQMTSQLTFYKNEDKSVLLRVKPGHFKPSEGPAEAPACYLTVRSSWGGTQNLAQASQVLRPPGYLQGSRVCIISRDLNQNLVLQGVLFLYESVDGSNEWQYGSSSRSSLREVVN